MKKTLVTLGLAAAVAGSLFATAPARADEPPQWLSPPARADLRDLKLKPILPIVPHLLLARKAELTTDLTIFKDYHPLYNPQPHPNYRVIWCVVKNWGLRDSGPFKTLLRIHRVGLPTLYGGAHMSVSMGQAQLIGMKVFAPSGVSRAFSDADYEYAVPEYNESNNFDLIP